MKTAKPYAEALALAEELRTILAPHCARIEIAGSLRRRKAEIGDIELVAIPHYEIERDLFGEEVGRRSLLDAELRAWPPITGTMIKNGERYKQFTWDAMPVDLFLVTADTWAVQLAIRTGSADFSHWLVTANYHGGALPMGYVIAEGRLARYTGPDPHTRRALPIATPEEADLFTAIGLPWIPPEERTAGRWLPDRWHPRRAEDPQEVT